MNELESAVCNAESNGVVVRRVKVAHVYQKCVVLDEAVSGEADLLTARHMGKTCQRRLCGVKRDAVFLPCAEFSIYLLKLLTVGEGDADTAVLAVNFGKGESCTVGRKLIHTVKTFCAVRAAANRCVCVGYCLDCIAVAAAEAGVKKIVDKVKGDLHIGAFHKIGEDHVLFGEDKASLTESSVAAIAAAAVEPELIAVALRPVGSTVGAVIGLEARCLLYPIFR